MVGEALRTSRFLLSFRLAAYNASRTSLFLAMDARRANDRRRSRSRRGKRENRRAERPERISRLTSYWLRHGLKDLRAKGIDVTRHGEVSIAALIAMPQFKRYGVTKTDLQSIERLQVCGNLVRCRQGISDPLVDDGAYDELDIDDIPELAFHATRSRCRESILAGGVKPGSDLVNFGARPHAYFHPTLEAAKDYVAGKDGRRVILCVRLKAAAQAGAIVLRTSQGCLLVPTPGVEHQFVVDEHAIPTAPAPVPITQKNVVDSAPPQDEFCVDSHCDSCARYQTTSVLRPLFCAWKEAAVLTPAGSHALCKFGVTSTEDIKYLAANSEEAAEMGILAEWKAAADTGCFGDLAAARFLHAASQSLPAVVRSASPPAKRRAYAPRTSSASEAKDVQRRKDAARALVETSKHWRKIPDAAMEAMVDELMRFEARVISSANRAWVSWVAYCNELSLDPLRHGTTEFTRPFIDAEPSATGPLGMFNKLTFLIKHCGAPLALPMRPIAVDANGFVAAELQGVVVEPTMLARLEALEPALREKNDWRLGALYGAVLIARSSVRYAHLQRSVLVSRDENAFWSECYRGKSNTGRGRAAFRHCCPRTGLCDGPDVLDGFWEMWNRHKTTNPDLSAMVLDANTGLALCMQTFHEAVRELAILADSCTEDSAKMLTSKSFRMVQVTMCDVREADYAERCAVGDWKGAPRGQSVTFGKRSLVPFRYQGAKEQTAIFTKALQLKALKEICNKHSLKAGSESPVTWDVVRREWLDIATVVLQKGIADAIARATTPIIAIGAESKAVKAPKSFVIPAKKMHECLAGYDSSESEGEAIEGDKNDNVGEGDTDSSEDSGGESGEDMALVCLVPDDPRTPFHIESELGNGIPACRLKSHAPFARGFQQYASLRAAFDTGKALCKSCLKNSGADVKAFAARY